MKSKHVVADKSKQQSSDLASNSRSPAGRPINHAISIPDTCVIRRTFQRRNERMNISVWYRESAPGGQFKLIHQLAPCGWHSTSICICLSILTLQSDPCRNFKRTWGKTDSQTNRSTKSMYVLDMSFLVSGELENSTKFILSSRTQSKLALFYILFRTHVKT